MAANPINIVPKRHAVLYTGTNSGDIIAADGFDLNNSSVDGGGIWTFQSPPDSTGRTVNPNEWIVYSQNAVEEVHDGTAFSNFYICNTICDDLDMLEGGPAIQSMGVAAVPTLILNATTTVAVTLHPAMPDSGYSAYAMTFAGVSLANLTITSVTVVDEDTVNVGLQNTGLITLIGASVLVHAVA